MRKIIQMKFKVDIFKMIHEYNTLDTAKIRYDFHFNESLISEFVRTLCLNSKNELKKYGEKPTNKT